MAWTILLETDRVLCDPLGHVSRKESSLSSLPAATFRSKARCQGGVNSKHTGRSWGAPSMWSSGCVLAARQSLKPTRHELALQNGVLQGQASSVARQPQISRSRWELNCYHQDTRRGRRAKSGVQLGEGRPGLGLPSIQLWVTAGRKTGLRLAGSSYYALQSLADALALRPGLRSSADMRSKGHG